MRYPISVLWQTWPPDMEARVKAFTDRASRQTRPVTVFFRADDIGVPGKKLSQLMAGFSRHQVPLSLAVVPAWLTRPRWQALRGAKIEQSGFLPEKTPELWCWHQHGWRHQNHQPSGKKGEFGDSRTPAAIHQDLKKGRDRLQGLMGEDFYPAFTPPWNRCGLDALKSLKKLGFQAVSRGQGDGDPRVEGLPDIPVNIDLHTRKEPDPKTSWDRFWAECNIAGQNGFCGFMIHHQRMNQKAFDFLDILLPRLKTGNFRFVMLRDYHECLTV